MIGQYLESERVQRVADENRRCLIVRDVHGGAAATKVVIVHGRQVVMHERIGVNHLDRRGDRVDLRRFEMQEFAARIGEQRSDALAPIQERVAYGLQQSGTAAGVGRQPAIEFFVYALAVLRRAVREA